MGGVWNASFPLTTNDALRCVSLQKMDQIKAKLSMKKKRLGGAQAADRAVGNEAPEAGSEKSAHRSDGRPAAPGSADITDNTVGSNKTQIRNASRIRHKKHHHLYGVGG